MMKEKLKVISGLYLCGSTTRGQAQFCINTGGTDGSDTRTVCTFMSFYQQSFSTHTHTLELTHYNQLLSIKK